MKHIIIATITLLSLFSYSQEKDFKHWKEHEIKNYNILKELAEYVNNKEANEISKDTLFEKHIYFDYVLNDTLIARKERRLKSFDTLFSFFRKPIDSLGINNIDAKPIRFYKEHEIYEPFDIEQSKLTTVDDEKMYAKDTNVFTYYRKEDPGNPLGALLFEPKTNKLLAWIMINQGGYKYFLTFNLL